MKKSRLPNVFIIVIILSGIFVPYAYSEDAGKSILSVDPTTLTIDTESSCVTAECHAGMGKKKFVHGVGVDGKHCIKCHSVTDKGVHKFELPSAAIELCAQCHSGKYISPTDIEGAPPKIIAPSDIFEEGEKAGLHEPFLKGKCTECHDAHESDYYLHLKGSYPESLYASYSIEEYGLCIKCHKDFEKVLTEPRSLTITNFRNGNLNLHFRHVNRKKGRSCKACHHPHGSDSKKLIRETFLFGTRKLAINYKNTETGGGCAPSCHMPLKYDRYDPVDVLMKTTPRLGEDASARELKVSEATDTEKNSMEVEKVETEEVETEDKQSGERSNQ